MALFQCKLLHEDAQMPRRAHDSDAGLDISSVEDVIIPAGEQRMVATGISIRVPQDCYVRVAPRSGLAAKHMINIHAGVVDSGYRGEIKVIMMNHGAADFAVAKGDRVAQLIFERIYVADFELTDDLDASDRGAGGFGSTGVN